MKNRLQLLALLLPALFALSCNDWLDVKPRQQIEADVLFGREEGFKDALAAIYINMMTPDMYGTEMTFGLVDVLGLVYPSTGRDYTYAKEYEYDNPFVERLINNIWQKSYNTIANLNSLITNLREADQTMFAQDNYNVILGEALGLRAYIHFDLLRLFAPSYKANPNAPAIPYITKYGFKTTPQYTVSAVLDSVLRDANEALTLLKRSDPIYTGREVADFEDDGYLLNRKDNMNYYAVTAFKSRVHLYRGDLSNAAQCAEEVIDSEIARWITFSEVSGAEPDLRDRSFAPEHIFSFACLKLTELANSRLARLSGGGPTTLVILSFPQNYLNTTLFTRSDDWRYRFLYRLPVEAINPAADFECIKYGAIGVSPNMGFRSLLPAIRLPEMYLTLAEALLETNPARSAELVNEMTINRGIAGGLLAPDASVETIRQVIFDEFRREFVAEGQLFFYHKRLDLPTIAGGPPLFDKSNYVLPMPKEEVEFGKRN